LRMKKGSKTDHKSSEKIQGSASPSSQSISMQNPDQGEPLPAIFEFLFDMIARFQRFAWDIAGMATLAFGLITLLSLPTGLDLTMGGTWITAWGVTLKGWFGYGSIFVVIACFFAGLHMLRQRTGAEDKINWAKVIALEISAFSALILSSALGGISLERADAGLDGGRIGWGLAELTGFLLSYVGLTSINWLYAVVVPIFLLSTLAGLGLAKPLMDWLSRVSQTYQPLPADGYPADGYAAQDYPSGPAVSMAPISEEEAHSVPVAEKKKKRTILPPEFRKKFQVQAKEEKASQPPPRDERLPPLSLLINENVSRPDERNINLTAGLIEKTLAEFGIPAKVVGFRMGPTVTQFAVEPGFTEKPGSEGEANRHKVRVAQISGLSRDLALALAADRLRIEAPVPGRPYVGIEVPNIRSSVVRLRPVLESEAIYKINSPLAIALGRDVSGQPVVADLVSMPHLLIAGTTGSGKSVCIAALTTCLVMNNTPEDLRLVMIDPKMVELVRFNGLPHLYGKVETKLERILGVLRWTVAEMDRRYKLLEAMHARHIDSYNRKIRRRKDGEILPRIVVMIDELADLMMSAPDQTEPALVRLAQLARATGIHLVVATQRPSTDVVTGLIKANFPARIAFAVASSVDSRVILDTSGAESLLGHGDMLFLPPEASAPIRSQGVMVTDQEVEKVITFWQSAQSKGEKEAPPWEEMLAEEEVLADRDELVKKAIALVQETKRASASLLQRRLKIGYPRAARLMDELEELGIIGPSARGGREREVLVDGDDETGPYD
jgi:DNA segregation ATPase FtsK/SpoIIIE, S-DNA-T family